MENGSSLLAEELRKRIGRDTVAVQKLDALIASYERTLYEAELWPHVQGYNAEIAKVFGRPCAAPTYFLHTSWSFDHPIGSLHNEKLAEVFGEFEKSLISDLHENSIEGDVIEFGIYKGYMLGKLLEHAEKIGLRRKFYGFDSFEGLSEPNPQHDYDSWKKGQYSAGYDEVAKYLRLSERPYLTLVPGWLEDSLFTPAAQAITRVAYARIDVDIHDPTVDCLNFLTGRMADRGVLVFDDWAYTAEKGESKAFLEWARRTPQYRFEWLGQCGPRFYLRVHHQ